MPKKCIYNRSPIAVGVRHRPELYREFSHTAGAKAHEYAQCLQREGLKPSCRQLANVFQVMLRAKGYPDYVRTFDSLQEAEEALAVIRAQRVQEIFVDYSPSWSWKLYALIERYLDDECPKHKGFADEASRLRAWLED